MWLRVAFFSILLSSSSLHILFSYDQCISTAINLVFLDLSVKVAVVIFDLTEVDFPKSRDAIRCWVGSYRVFFDIAGWLLWHWDAIMDFIWYFFWHLWWRLRDFGWRFRCDSFVVSFLVGELVARLYFCLYPRNRCLILTLFSCPWFNFINRYKS